MLRRRCAWLAQGAAPYTYMRERGDTRPMKVAPAAANSRRAVLRYAFEWYAIFEFREDGRWYCTVFARCCD